MCLKIKCSVTHNTISGQPIDIAINISGFTQETFSSLKNFKHCWNLNILCHFYCTQMHNLVTVVSMVSYIIFNHRDACNAQRGYCCCKVTGWMSCHTPVLRLNCQTYLETFSTVFSDPCTDTQLQGEPHQRGRKIHREFAIFNLNRRLSLKWCEIGLWLLWNINRY